MRKKLHPSFGRVHCQLDTSSTILFWLFSSLVSLIYLWIVRGCLWFGLWYAFGMYFGLMFLGLLSCLVFPFLWASCIDNPFYIFLFFSPLCHFTYWWDHFVGSSCTWVFFYTFGYQWNCFLSKKRKRKRSSFLFKHASLKWGIQFGLKRVGEEVLFYFSLFFFYICECLGQLMRISTNLIEQPVWPYNIWVLRKLVEYSILGRWPPSIEPTIS